MLSKDVHIRKQAPRSYYPTSCYPFHFIVVFHLSYLQMKNNLIHVGIALGQPLKLFLWVCYSVG